MKMTCSRLEMWRRFIISGRNTPGINPLIEASWTRCLSLNLDPYRIDKERVLSQTAFRQRIEQYDLLLKAALPAMDWLYSYLRGKDVVLYLVDESGFILKSIGDQGMIIQMRDVNLIEGANWLEDTQGTNGIGTALHEGKPVRVASEEHYCQHFHFLSCYGTPIFDTRRHLVAALDVTIPGKKDNPYILPTVASVGALIQNNLWNLEWGGNRQVTTKKIEASAYASRQNSVIIGDEGLIDDRPKTGSLIIPGSDCREDVLIAGQPATQTDDTFKSIVGSSPAMRNAKALAQKAAGTSSTVMLLGETGTGKEVFARAIHLASPRKQEPFVALNCGGITQGLAESEFFGYEDGAYTGAKKGGQVGKFELAQGGTLFLDEIGDLPLPIQTSLLRVLQERCFCRVGGNRNITVDARIIAATNKDLRREVEMGMFRRDLYYRLNVMSIELPPLREREDDLFVIAQAYLAKVSGRHHLTPLVEKIFRSYNWPGNVRELCNILERAIILAEDVYILPQHLPYDLIASGKQKSTGMKSLKWLEEQTIRETFQKCRGNVSETARLLGISRNTIYRKLGSNFPDAPYKTRDPIDN